MNKQNDFFVNCYGNKFGNLWSQKISIPPPGKGSNFPGGGGVNLPNFPVGRGGGFSIGKYFQMVLMTHIRG